MPTAPRPQHAGQLMAPRWCKLPSSEEEERARLTDKRQNPGQAHLL